MKKIYNKPEIDCMKLSADWALCNGGGSNNTTGGGDNSLPGGFGGNGAPQKRTPAF